MTLSDVSLAEVADVFRLLADPSRLSIVLACMQGSRGVGEIAVETGLSPSLTSHHLRLLRTARLLRPERQGRSVRYALDDDHVRDVLRIMVAHVCEPHEHHAPSGR